MLQRSGEQLEARGIFGEEVRDRLESGASPRNRFCAQRKRLPEPVAAKKGGVAHVGRGEHAAGMRVHNNGPRIEAFPGWNVFVEVHRRRENVDRLTAGYKESLIAREGLEVEGEETTFEQLGRFGGVHSGAEQHFRHRRPPPRGT